MISKYKISIIEEGYCRSMVDNKVDHKMAPCLGLGHIDIWEKAAMWRGGEDVMEVCALDDGQSAPCPAPYVSSFFAFREWLK